MISKKTPATILRPLPLTGGVADEPAADGTGMGLLEIGLCGSGGGGGTGRVPPEKEGVCCPRVGGGGGTGDRRFSGEGGFISRTGGGGGTGGVPDLEAVVCLPHSGQKFELPTSAWQPVHVMFPPIRTLMQF